MPVDPLTPVGAEELAVPPRSQPHRRPAVISRQRSRKAAALHCLVALGFVGPFVAIGIVAASTAWTSSVASVLVIEACCVLPLVAVVFGELRPAATALWGGISNALARFGLSVGSSTRFRRQSIRSAGDVRVGRPPLCADAAGATTPELHSRS
jgi:hypothetical protein